MAHAGALAAQCRGEDAHVPSKQVQGEEPRGSQDMALPAEGHRTGEATQRPLPAHMRGVASGHRGGVSQEAGMVVVG